MRATTAAFLIASALIASTVAAPAWAAAFDDVFFVRTGATAKAMLEDRAACAAEALAFDIDGARGFSNAEYGTLSAMGSALQNGLPDADVRRAVRKAILGKCMANRGWTELAPFPEEAKALRKATLKRPEALDAWLRANAPKPPEPEPPASPNG